MLRHVLARRMTPLGVLWLSHASARSNRCCAKRTAAQLHLIEIVVLSGRDSLVSKRPPAFRKMPRRLWLNHRTFVGKLKSCTTPAASCLGKYHVLSDCRYRTGSKPVVAAKSMCSWRKDTHFGEARCDASDAKARWTQSRTACTYSIVKRRDSST